MKLVDVLVTAAAGKYLLDNNKKQSTIVKPIVNSTFDMNKYASGYAIVDLFNNKK